MRTLALWFSAALLAAAPRTPQKLLVEPHDPLLFGKGARQQLVVVLRYSDGTEEDVTAKARFVSARPAVAGVDAGGVVTAEANGGAEIRVRYAGYEAATTALVQHGGEPMPASFSGDILPVLTKIGCNGGSCHGALNGQNGFKLSLFGYDPAADYDMIVHKHGGRRLNLADPEKSLLLEKPTFQVPHGGGKRLKKGSADYNTLLAWIRGGAKLVPANERRVVSLTVTPTNTVLFGKGATRQLLVTARYSDGTERDVTRTVGFQSNDDSLVKVSAEGLVTAERGGETAITVRAPGVAAAAKVGVVTESREVPAIVSDNFIDRFVFEKLRELEIPPSEPCDDATFLRRAYLDIIGVIPSADEARRFLADRDPNKRAKLVDRLVERPEYADFWALYWGDHLNNTKQLLYNKGPYTFTRWLHDAFRKNMPYDQFARALLTSSGNMYDAPATSFYPLMKKEQDLAAITSQLFLGVSIECARCHNHPLEKWSRDDFNGMAAFFSQVRYKSAGPRNNERILYVDYNRQFQNPDTKQVFLPKPLNGPVMPSGPMTDRREMLADWITSPKNPYFRSEPPVPESGHQAGVPAQTAERPSDAFGPDDGPPGDAGRLDHFTQESLFRQGAGESHVAQLHGAGAGGAGGRFPGDESTDEPGIAGRAGQGFRGARLQFAPLDPADYVVAGVPAFCAAQRGEPRGQDGLRAALQPAHDRRADAGLHRAGDGRAGAVQVAVPGDAGGGTAGAGGRIVFSGSVRPAQPADRVRAQAAAESEPGDAPDQRGHDSEEDREPGRRAD